MEAASQTKKKRLRSIFHPYRQRETYFNSSKDLLSMDIEAPDYYLFRFHCRYSRMDYGRCSRYAACIYGRTYSKLQ